MSGYTFRAIQTWPRALTKNRKNSPFRSTYQQTLDLLQTELEHLGARNIVLQVALRPEDIRLDGLPRANAKPAVHPGVIVSFEKWTPIDRVKDGHRLGVYRPFSMPCDTFLDWESNLRAIALSLEALRKVDRYGVTESGEQYAGWAQLPAPATEGTTAERTAAATFISEHSGHVVTAQHISADALKRAYQVAARRLHPDAPGGSHELFIKLKVAFEILQKGVATNEDKR